MPEILLTRSAKKDLRKLGLGSHRERIFGALRRLGVDAANLDVKVIVGAPRWLRMRVGDYRVLYWLTPDDTYEVDRIIHRRDLDAAVANLSATDPS